jgi:L-ascorbate metabolism protein UlaG (beta-lactamase superfamily)
VIISHDHYDHLDLPTVKALAARGDVRWVVPLGVGAHLRAWGVAERDVTELDWWGAVVVQGVTVTATPARHFSGRGPGDQNRTLWAGWAVAGPAHRVFYSGDTALHDEFARSAAARAVRPDDDRGRRVRRAVGRTCTSGPEQAVLAHRLVRGAVMLPVHWGLFDLALHGWTEPMERVLVAARAAGVRVARRARAAWSSRRRSARSIGGGRGAVATVAETPSTRRRRPPAARAGRAWRGPVTTGAARRAIATCSRGCG